MYVSISQADEAATHQEFASQPGFRWAMVLRPTEGNGGPLSASMWLNPAQAEGGGATSGDGYDVATARGSMTPATHVVLVEWTVPEEASKPFASRWNAVYHAIEDKIGSRLLRRLDATDAYVGLHVVQDGAVLTHASFEAPVTESDVSITPSSVRRYEVASLTEA